MSDTFGYGHSGHQDRADGFVYPAVTGGSSSLWSVELTSDMRLEAGKANTIEFRAHNLDDSNKSCKVQVAILGLADTLTAESGTLSSIEVGDSRSGSVSITVPASAARFPIEVVATVIPGASSFTTGTALVSKLDRAIYPPVPKELASHSPGASSWYALYTVPTGGAAALEVLSICNAGTGNAAISVASDADGSWNGSGTPDVKDYRFKGYVLAASATVLVDFPGYLDSGGKLWIHSTTTNVAFKLSGVENV